MAHCHCSLCRKAHGTAFVTWLAAPEAAFAWLRGEGGLGGFQSSSGVERRFCRRCGSVAPLCLGSGQVFLPAGCLDGDPEVRPAAHAFVGSKAAWYEIADDLPQVEDTPPGADPPAVHARPELPDVEGIRGSCLCGGIAFALDPPLELIIQCHCSRCRKARSAAHAANLFAPQAAFRFLRGEELIDRFPVPGARAFAHSFCRVCGSSAPRVRPGETALVPAGLLDDGPGARPRFHIYVGSKAPWFELADALPRFDEGPPGR